MAAATSGGATKFTKMMSDHVLKVEYDKGSLLV
jgi:hypothetical protein